MLRRCSLALAVLVLSLTAFAQKQRHFTFHYSFTVKNVEAGKPLRIWIPLAHPDPSQDVRVTSQTGDLPLKRTRDTEDGNWMLYAETTKATKFEY
jgi:uncharacterized protein (DUF58 family)